MNRVFTPRRLDAQDILKQLQYEPQAAVDAEGARYESEVRAVAEQLRETMPDRCLVLLSGPSASGKTTTALKLERYLQTGGREAYTVSLDNFYQGYGKAPRLPDGSFDYESVNALNLPLLRTCMEELLSDGCTQLPEFDFMNHQPKPHRRELRVPNGSVVIFEGIHALHPLLREQLPEEQIFTMFINVMSPIEYQGKTLFTQRDLRLIRRLLRDLRFRNSSPENTMDMWRQVVRGEELYLFPYADTATVAFDTTHAYEPAVFASQLLPFLRALPENSRHQPIIQHLITGLSVFEPFPVTKLPAEALLREFVG